MINKLLIQNGLVVTGDAETVADVLCEGEKIIAVGKIPAGLCAGAGIIDAAGKIVIPGGVDVHTHMNITVGSTESCDDFYSGTVAAACGGTTSIVDHPGFGPAGCALDYQIKKYHGLAEGKAVIDYGFHGVLQHADENVFTAMEALAGEGITSFKAYLTYAHAFSDSDIFKVLRRAKDLGIVVAVHAENNGVINLLRDEYQAAGKTGAEFHPRSRPAECEAEAVSRMILFARLVRDAPLYIVHLTCALGLELIRAARMRGQKNLRAETCPQYLLLDDSLYSQPGNEGLKYIMSPPLRSPSDRDALWQGLESDIDVIGTDHCSFLFASHKMQGKDNFALCPGGIPGVEERIPLLYSEGVAKGRMSLRRFTDLCCASPAKLFGMYPQKGVIAPGSDADIVIIDPDRQVILGKDLHSNADYSAYEGFPVQGWPVCTVSRGETIVQDGKFLGHPGRGKFIKRGISIV